MPPTLEHGLAVDGADVGRQPLLAGVGRRGHGVGADALDHDVVAVAAVEDVDAGAADEHVVAAAAEQHVVAVAADEHVVAVAAVGGELSCAGGQQPEASTTSSPASALTVSRSLAASAPVMLTRAARPTTARPVASPATIATSSPFVPWTMTLSGWRVAGAAGGRQVGVHLGHVGAAEVVDDDRCRRRRAR